MQVMAPLEAVDIDTAEDLEFAKVVAEYYKGLENN